MARLPFRIRLNVGAAVACLPVLMAIACANLEAERAQQVALQRLKCPNGEVAAGLNRETPQVREWIAGCNFTYTRVHCTDRGCAQAEPKPPCIGDLPCFEEDPVTLKWTLRDAH